MNNISNVYKVLILVGIVTFFTVAWLFLNFSSDSVGVDIVSNEADKKLTLDGHMYFVENNELLNRTFPVVLDLKNNQIVHLDFDEKYSYHHIIASEQNLSFVRSLQLVGDSVNDKSHIYFSHLITSQKKEIDLSGFFNPTNFSISGDQSMYVFDALASEYVEDKSLENIFGSSYNLTRQVLNSSVYLLTLLEENNYQIEEFRGGVSPVWFNDNTILFVGTFGINRLKIDSGEIDTVALFPSEFEVAKDSILAINNTPDGKQLVFLKSGIDNSKKITTYNILSGGELLLQRVLSPDYLLDDTVLAMTTSPSEDMLAFVKKNNNKFTIEVYDSRLEQKKVVHEFNSNVNNLVHSLIWLPYKIDSHIAI